MDFYAYQAAARRQSRWFVLLFVAVVAAVVLALDAVVFTGLAAREAAAPYAAGAYADDSSGGAPGGPLAYAARHPDTAFGLSVLILGVIGVASLFKSLELRGGGAVVARSLGGVRVEEGTTDLKRRRLRNIVEEMAIASGVPVPEIYVLEQEPAINAFAAGQTPANAAITVTQGALDRLSREELQGVIGHEFSHVVNGDMRLNVQLMGAIFGLLVVAVIGRLIFSFAPRGRSRRDGGGLGVSLLAIGLAVMVLGYIGQLAGQLLQAAVSRQRERLADASSVQFTRNAQGLKGALVKIARLDAGSRLVAADGHQVAHMLFAPGVTSVFDTHPPLLQRIRELDPNFDPRELDEPLPPLPDMEQEPEAVSEAGPGAAPGGAARPAWVPGQPPAQPPGAAGFSRAGAAGISQAGAAVAAVMPRAGAVPAIAGVAPAGAASASAPAVAPGPPPEQQAASITAQARTEVLALVLSREPAVRDAQVQLIARALGPGQRTAVEAASPWAASVPPMARLPALLQRFPALRRLPLTERRALSALVNDLIHADSAIDVFEFCLAKLLGTLLQDEMSAQAPHGRLGLGDAAQAIHVLIATLARCGSDVEQEIGAAYEAGMKGLLAAHPPYATYDDWPQRTSQALDVLTQLQPQGKQLLIQALVRTIASDGQLRVEEDELLRTTCALLHCPVPALGAD